VTEAATKVHRGRTPRFLGEGRISFAEREFPEPAAGQLLVRVAANAICGTDRHQYDAGSDVTPGHEAAGSVVAAGPDTSVAPGTRGVIFLMDFCGSCRSCRIGATNQCLQKRADMGFTHDGGYGPCELIHENIFFAIPDELALADATLLLDVMGTSRHAVERLQLVREDIESVLIAGAGPIGLGSAIMVKLLLGEDVAVYISDVADFRLELARSLGAVPIRAESLAKQVSVGAFDPVDAAIDCSGRAQARQTCVDALAQRGALACVGHGETIFLDVSRQLIAPERAVLGSEYFRFDSLAPNLELLLAHRERITQVITHRFPIEELDVAFATFLGGQTGKVIVEHGNGRP
jgi:threonine 3-dehydrogenase